MRLYQHSARCPIALRSFLDCNPIYWCFIPLHWNEALTENTVYGRGTADIDPTLVYMMATTVVDNRRVTNHLDRVPLPPAAYAFSYQQVKKQRLFFQQLISSPINQLPYDASDLYQLAIIAVCK